MARIRLKYFSQALEILRAADVEDDSVYLDLVTEAPKLFGLTPGMMASALHVSLGTAERLVAGSEPLPRRSTREMVRSYLVSQARKGIERVGGADV